MGFNGIAGTGIDLQQALFQERFNQGAAQSPLVGRIEINGATDDEKKANGGGTKDTVGAFGDMLKNAMGEVNQLSQASEKMTTAYAAGADIPLHQVMIAMNRSGVAMDLAVQVRNKLVQAYQEVSRMAI